MYVAACADGTLYTGYTTDLARRIAMHNADRGARYTRGRGPVRLVYHEALSSRAEAQRREAAIKRLNRREKQALIAAAEEPKPPGPGVLYLCATPIGNLEDVTLRVLRVLREADVVAAEDTRQARKLLSHYEISTPVISCHGHNERRAAAEIVERLRSGQTVALVSDAGAPTVSDPGAEVVRQAREAGCQVVALPGPSAVLTALAASGQPADRFVFEGFLPRAGGERGRRLRAIAADPRPVVLFEAPHRLVRTLRDLSAAIGDRPVIVARELTKHFEEYREGPAAELAAHYEAAGARGEFTLVVARADAAGRPEEGEAGEAGLAAALASVARRIREGSALADAVKAAARESGLPRRDVYRSWIAARGESAGNESTLTDKE